MTAEPQTTTRYQEKQLVAGVYRLAVLHHADQSSEVWRALDEQTHHVVTIEFLTARDDMSRQRFLAEARRMASIKNPAVMRVAQIREDPAETFVVYEHLVHVPVDLKVLKIGADEPPVGVAGAMSFVQPPAAPVVQPAPVPAPPPPVTFITPGTPAPVVQPAPVTAAAPVPAPPPPVTFITPSAPAPEVAVDAEEGEEEEAAPTGFVGALRALVRERVESSELMAGLLEAATDVWAELRPLIEQFREEFPETRLGRWLASFDSATVLAAIGAVASKAASSRPALPSVRRRSAGSAPAADAAAPMAPAPAARPAKPLKVKTPKVRAPREPRVAKAPSGPSLLSRIAGRVRWRRTLFRGASLAIIVTALMTVPADQAMDQVDFLATHGTEIAGELASTGAMLASDIAKQVGAIASDLGPQIGKLVPPASSAAPRLARPGFEAPPLSAYAATFESQAPYPHVAPGADVEWVVALRNTGSAGWYRGLDGAQASVALSDGTLVAVQSTDYVGPGQVGWFVTHFKAATEPGTYDMPLLPRIEGRGELPNLHVHVVVTVTKP